MLIYGLGRRLSSRRAILRAAVVRRWKFLQEQERGAKK